MKRIILLLAITISLTSFKISVEYVYICKGPYSKKYHLKTSCHGLNNCSTETYKVTLTDAKKLNRTLCGFED